MRVYDKQILIQRLSDSGEWKPWKRLRAFVNKAKDSTSSLTFEVRYTQSLKEIFSYLEEFIIVYRGDVYLIEDYDDYMEQHLNVRFKASVLRLGKFTSDLTVLQKSITDDEEGFSSYSYTPVSVIRCYREGRQGSTRWENLAAFSETTDLFQIRKPDSFELTRSYTLEHGGDLFEILDIERIKGHNLYLQILAKRVEGVMS